MGFLFLKKGSVYFSLVEKQMNSLGVGVLFLVQFVLLAGTKLNCGINTDN